MELQKQSKGQLVKLLSSGADVSTIRKALRSVTVSETVSAPLVSAYTSEEKFLIHEYIIRELDRLQAYYNLPDSKKYDTETLEDVAFDFMDKHKHETVEDFALFFKMIRHGKIKALRYERFGFDTLQEAFSEYLTEHKIPQLEKKHKKHKQDMDKIDKNQAGSYADVLKTIEANMKSEQAKKQKKREDSPSMTFEDEMEALMISLPHMRIEELRKARKAYMNASVMQHVEGEQHPAIKIIDYEIDRRG